MSHPDPSPGGRCCCALPLSHNERRPADDSDNAVTVPNHLAIPTASLAPRTSLDTERSSVPETRSNVSMARSVMVGSDRSGGPLGASLACDSAIHERAWAEAVQLRG